MRGSKHWINNLEDLQHVAVDAAGDALSGRGSYRTEVCCNANDVAHFIAKKIGEFLETNYQVFPQLMDEENEANVRTVVAIYQQSTTVTGLPTVEGMIKTAINSVTDVFSGVPDIGWDATIPDFLDENGQSFEITFTDFFETAGDAVGEILVNRYNVQDHNPIKQFNIMDIVEQVMAIAKEADMKSYLLAYLGFDKYLDKFETATELTADDIGDFVGQKIAVALEEIIPQIIQLQEYGEDIKLIVAIYNNSPLATGFAGIEGTGTVEDIFKTVIGLITGVIDALIAETGLEFKLPPQFDGQTFGELAIEQGDRIATFLATRYNMQDGGRDPPDIEEVFWEMVEKIKNGIADVIDQLDFRDELDEIVNGDAGKTMVVNFVSDTLGTFLEIVFPVMTQFRFWGPILRPLVDTYNDIFGWAFSTQDAVQFLIDGMYLIFRELPGAGTRIPGMGNEKLKNIFEDYKDKVGLAFATRYNLQE